jgi:hypothetical protein
MGATLCARLVLPNMNKRPANQFPWSAKKGKTKSTFPWDKGEEVEIEVPDGIIAHVTSECGGNVHDCHLVEVTSGSFEKVTEGDHGCSGAKNPVDLEAGSLFASAYRLKEEDIPHTRTNWLCYDFKERRIMATPYTIGTHYGGLANSHLKSWLIETSADGEN